MTSTTITAYAQGDIEEAIAGLINPNITTIYNAKRIITMDDKNVSATAVAVTGDRIVAVGSLDSVKNALGTTPYSVDNTFGERYIMPGLIVLPVPISASLSMKRYTPSPSTPLTHGEWRRSLVPLNRIRLQTSP